MPLTQLSVFLDTPQGYVQLMLSEKRGNMAKTVKESLGLSFLVLNHLKHLHTISLIVLVYCSILFIYYL